MSFVILPSSVSDAAILADLDAFLASAPDSAAWNAFFQSSTGTLVKRMIAGLGTFLDYNVVAARREAFIRYAQNRSSIIAEAESFGYSAFRGKNHVLQLTVTPNVTTVWPRWTPVGSVKDQDLVTESQVVVNAGVPVTFNVVVGNVKEDSLVAASIDPALFRFKATDFSEDVRVFLNSTEVQSSERLLDLINGIFVIQSNVYGAADILYLNLDSFVVRYSTGDTIGVKWIALANPDFVLSDVQFFPGTLSAIQVVSQFQPIESQTSIAINGPLANETQYVIRGRNDYLKIFLLTDTSLLSTSGQDVSPAVVKLFYVRSDNTLFTQAEKDALVVKLASNRPFGVAPPVIDDPTMVFLSLAVTATLLETGNITDDVHTLVQSYANKLNQAIDFKVLENKTNKFKNTDGIEYVEISRYAFNPTTWTASTLYRRGKQVVPTAPSIAQSAYVYEALAKVLKSGATEPVWDDTIGGINPDEVDDLSAGVRAHITYNDVCFVASNPGPSGNLITLTFDGTKDCATVVADWNGANPGNPVQICLSSLLAGAATLVLPAGTATLADGAGPSGSSAGVNGSGSGLAWQTVALSGAPTAWAPGTVYLVPGQVIDGTQQPQAGSIVAPSAAAIIANPALANRMFVAVGGINRAGADLPASSMQASYSGTDYLASNPGAAGNGISLTFDGLLTVSQVVTAWNLANPTNQVSFSPSGNAGDIPPAGVVTGSGGAGTQAVGTYSGTDFGSNTYGDGGNGITLTFDGTKTVAQVTEDWNNQFVSTGTALGGHSTDPTNIGKNVTNFALYTPAAAGSLVLPAGTLTLSGGTSAVNREPAWPTNPSQC